VRIVISFVCLWVVFGLWSVPTFAATPTPTSDADRCEPNDAPTQPCALPLETDNNGLNFRDDAVDVFSFLLTGGQRYKLRAAGNDLALGVAVSRAGASDKLLVRAEPGAEGVTEVELQPEQDGWYLVVIEQRAADAPRSAMYTLSVRRSVALPTPEAATPTPLLGDAYENNYSLETAARLAWGVPYDLSLVCPEAGACISGDHDFLLVPIKAQVPFVAATYDLGPGSDTTLALYRPEAGFTDPGTGLVGWRLVQGSDDLVAGVTLRSQVLLTPDWTGDALLIIAPSPRSEPPVLPAASGPPGRYRLIVGSPALPSVREVLTAQRDTPTSSATPLPTTANREPSSEARTAPLTSAGSIAPQGTPVTAAPARGQDDEERIREQCTAGMAVVRRNNAAFYAAAPADPRRLLATYPQNANIRLLGSCYLGWVKVQPEDSVTPGWMFGPDLRLELTANTGSLVSPSTATDTGGPLATSAPLVSTPSAAAQQLKVQALPLATPVQQRVLRSEDLNLVVDLRDDNDQLLSGLRVQVVNAFGERLAEALTSNVALQLPVSRPEGAALWLRVPALGLDVPLNGAGSTIKIRVAGGA
jgi:hypothetical protein